MKTITNSFHVGMYIFLCTQYINEIQLFLPQMFETNKINDFSSEVIAYCFKGIDAKKALNFKVCFRSYSSQMSTYNLQHLFLLEFAAYFGICWNSKSKSLVLLRFHLRDVFLFLLFFSIVDFGTFFSQVNEFISDLFFFIVSGMCVLCFEPYLYCKNFKNFT